MAHIVIIAGKANITGWCHMSASLPGFHEHNHLTHISLSWGHRRHQLGWEITLLQTDEFSLNGNEIFTSFTSNRVKLRLRFT